MDSEQSREKHTYENDIKTPGELYRLIVEKAPLQDLGGSHPIAVITERNLLLLSPFVWAKTYIDDSAAIRAFLAYHFESPEAYFIPVYDIREEPVAIDSETFPDHQHFKMELPNGVRSLIGSLPDMYGRISIEDTPELKDLFVLSSS